MKYKTINILLMLVSIHFLCHAQNETVRLVKRGTEKRIDIIIGGMPFTSFLYPDSLEKPVLYPVYAADGIAITRGFPLNPRPGDPTDHPHHIGIWLNYENVNGLDFWNNSYAIPKEKKRGYGWIRTDRILEMSAGKTGKLAYHANWTNQKNRVLLEETTHFEFSGTAHRRIIDRVTVLKADTVVAFNDAKDGVLGLRLAHELQIPALQDQSFTDDKGNKTVVKGSADKVANGNYITSEGKKGDAAWSTRGRWCEVYGKMGKDSISIAIIDHPENPNYPTFWHARGYGLFAANPLGEKVFTNGKSAKNLHLNPGESVTFRYRMVISEGDKNMSAKELNGLADSFAGIH